MKDETEIRQFPPSSFILAFSATGGIRTHTIRILRPAPPAELGYRGVVVSKRKLQESNLPSPVKGSPVFGTGPRAKRVRASEVGL